ncbi:hypothetical protein IC620_02650, partial [Hazenella sp. IB182357]|nr:hypothetical protein [Polycladospora coralii]
GWLNGSVFDELKENDEASLKGDYGWDRRESPTGWGNDRELDGHYGW